MSSMRFAVALNQARTQVDGINILLEIAQVTSGVNLHSATYDEAETYCSNAGGRLCTAAELLAECTRGSGCSHDHDHM